MCVCLVVITRSENSHALILLLCYKAGMASVCAQL